MDSLLYTALALITSAGSAALAYLLMDGRQRVAVGEERLKSAAVQLEQMRQVLELVAGNERPGAPPYPYGELLEADPLLEAYPGLQRMVHPMTGVIAMYPPGALGATAESPRGIEAGTAPCDVASDEADVTGRSRHRFMMRVSTPGSWNEDSVPHAGMVGPHFRRRGYRRRPRTR